MPMDKRKYAHGTFLILDMPFGFYQWGKVMCSDGKVRALKRISATADTFFSVPAAVSVRGRTVSGYVTVETVSGNSVATADDPAVAKFIAYEYGINHDMLPGGSWPQNED